MSLLRNIFINANSAINQRRWLRAEAGRLRNLESALAGDVVRAFDGVLRNEFSAQEVEQIRGIEALRRHLLLSFDRLEAGEPGLGAVMTVARAALSSKSAFWARVLFKLVREWKPSTCLELGTNMGLSAAYQASALKLNGAGSLTTLEGEEPRARIARRNFEQLGLDNAVVVVGRFRDTLPGVLSHCGPIGFAFIDGHHDRDATRDYFDQITFRLARPAVIVLDDISWSHGMRQAWAGIREDPRVVVSADLRVLGLCVVE